MTSYTDKELLELAAKAIGLKYHAFVNDYMIGFGLNIGDLETPIWNPLTDDGDALRLAVKLKMVTEISETGGTQWLISVIRGSAFNDQASGDDPYAAMRRAITSTAAEIGKTS